MQKHNKISACLIVKNEEKFLDRCLTSIRGLVDEIILVDTGSDDRTCDIAASYDCRIFHFPWQGDFSAARNESLRHATGEWIFIIDADEELPSDSVDIIRTAVDKPKNQILSLTVYNKSLSTGQVSSFLPSVRLFRKSLGLKYEGIVHNRLALPHNSSVVRCRAELYHYGYDLSHEELMRKRERSRQLLEMQLQQHPDDLFAHFNMAQLLRGMHGLSDPETCEDIIIHARKIIEHPDRATAGGGGYNLMAQVLMASALTTLGHYEDAEKYCRAALAEKPDYIDAMFVMAGIHLAAGHLDEAAGEYRRYLDHVDVFRPEAETSDIIMHYLEARQSAWYALGTIARIQGKSSDAIAMYRKVMAVQPYLDTYIRLGELYLITGQLSRAEEVYRRELEINRDSIPAYIGLGQALARQGQPDRALDCLDKALSLDLDSEAVKRVMAGILFQVGRNDRGIDILKTLEPGEINNPDSCLHAGNLWFQVGEMDRSESLFQRALEINPNYVEAINNLGNCRFRRHDFDQACSDYERVLSLSPDYWPAVRNYGAACLEVGRYGDGLRQLQKYTAHNPDDNEVIRLIADLLMASKQYKAAIKRYEIYLNKTPQDADALLHLSEAYYQLGSYEAAAAGFQRVLEAFPDCRAARDRLASFETPVSIS